MNESNQSVGNLKQMSDDMKQHIAQLKAEFGSAAADQRNVISDLHEGADSDSICFLQRQNTVESLSSVIPESQPHLGPLHSSNHVRVPTGAAIQLVHEGEVSSMKQKSSNLPCENAVFPATFTKSFFDFDESHDPVELNPAHSGQFYSDTLSSARNEAGIDQKATETKMNNAPSAPSFESLAAEFDERVGVSDTARKFPRVQHEQPGSIVSNTDTSTSSPHSVVEKTVEECIPVKYLQMSNTSPRLSKSRGPSKRGQTESLPLHSSGEQIRNGQSKRRDSKYEELEERLCEVQEQCEALAEENLRIKREKRSKAQEKIATLKKRNGELVNIARRLEEKARSLQEQTVKKTQELAAVTRDLQQQKRTHQRHKGRSDAEHARIIAEKDDALVSMGAQLEDLKKALRQTRRVKFLQASNDEDGDVLAENHKEMLRLQKLASAASSKVVVRSLSTPVTARQKILEESNRNLRRQVTALENRLRDAESKSSGSEEVENKLKSLEEENRELVNKINDLQNRTLNLESELEESKVETSDVSVQHSELKNIHIQLQNDYATVHEQLAVAIRERDQAVSQCIGNAGKLADVEMELKALRDEKQSFNALQNNHREAVEKHQKELSELHSTHGNVVKEYQDALKALQSKVAVLEQQCQEQNVNNKTLQDQLAALVTWSQKKTTPQPGVPACLDDNENNNNNNNNTAEDASDENPKRIFAEHESNLPPAVSPHRTGPVDTSGSAFKRPPSSSHNSSGLADLRRKSSSTSVSQRGGVDMDDTEAEDFEDEVRVTVAGAEPSQGVSDPVDQAPLRVFIAKYNYNPFEGPNEQPEAELPLVAGDYVYVHGEMDEDGFYEGELMDGHRGLVPSNYLEAVHDVPHTKRLMPAPAPGPRPDNSPGLLRPVSQRPALPEGSSIIFRPTSYDVTSGVAASLTGTSSVDSSFVESHELYTGSSDESSSQTSILPYPRKLRVDKKLSHSLIIGWVAPQLSEDDIVEEYHVLVDGSLATVVNGSKSKAVVEHIYHTERCYTISVCAVTERGRSEPTHCVLRFGLGDAPPVITHVSAEYVTKASARISWQPANSNFTHTISIGEVSDPKKKNSKLTHYKRQILVPCPMFWHNVTGLQPNTTYEVIIKSRTSKVEAETASLPIRFTTLEVEVPAPPLSVRVEEKLLDSSEYVVITWLPVALQQEGSSSNLAVTGYLIEVNDVQIATVEPDVCDQCQVPIRALADHVAKISRTVPLADPARVGSTSNIQSLRSPFNDRLPSVRVTVRTVALRKQVMSEPSRPYHLHRTLVSRLAQLAPAEEDVAKQGLDKRADEPTDSNGEQGSAHGNLRVVPSIEITQETSSDDEIVDQPSTSRRRTPSPGPKSPSDRRSARSVQGDSSRVVHQNRALDRKKRSKSSQFGMRRVADVGKSTSRRRTPSDDDSEGSSDITSTTTSGSLTHRYHLRSRSLRESPKRDRRLNDRVDRNDSTSLRRSSSEKHSNSPRSVHSDAQMTDASWHSHLSDFHGASRSTPLSRHVRQRHLASSHAQNGSGFLSDFADAFDDSRVLLFVALYDYDPYTMSPNKDMLEDELRFEEGQLLKIYGEKDGDGFYFGEKQDGTNGYIPCNMVTAVQVDDYTTMEELFERGRLPSVSPEGSRLSQTGETLPCSPPAEPTSYLHHGEVLQPRLCVAMFDYDPKQLSPNLDNDSELPFRRGDVLKIYGDMDDDGFYRGELNGRLGLVPSNFVEDYCPDQGSPRTVASAASGRSKHPPVSTASATTMTEPAPHVSPSLGAESASVLSTSSNNETSQRTDSVRKKSIISKGKKFLRKLGGNDSKQKR